ncbi:hypothetical protein QWY77_00235 [Thalassotalea ponticola]|uniref:hypothetical protein n=1 Tax=Thalassotalea ponticola TaxID=1523392 RepID=UPI0025B46678|nr:hypothetical protein [Thalassotalea ponticola]MDN3651211.1 hypothetical protein [Thalassotalea ponticola]
MDKFLLIVISFVLTSCSSVSNEEVACNFTDGAVNSKDSGVFNALLNGTVRALFTDSESNCVKRDLASCIDSEGEIKKECVVSK